MNARPRRGLFASRDTADAFAIAAPGLAPLVADELRELGVPVQNVDAAGVSFRTDLETLTRVNLWSRIASRVLVRLETFTARDFATLEKEARKIRWENVVPAGASVRLRVTCRKSRLYHSDAVAERVARSIIEHVSDADVVLRASDDEELERQSQLIVVRFERDVCTISADSSGELLHRRGWRQAIARAPLRETIAAAMLRACEWNGDMPLVDPFCGSGTIGIEAALRARNIAPGIARAFAFEHWAGVDAAVVRRERVAARALARDTNVRIVISDRDAGAVAAARQNAERAGVSEHVEIAQRSLSEVDLAGLGSSGLVLTNPPYGQRVSEGSDLRALYARLGDVVRAGGRGWRLAMLVPDAVLAGQTRLRFERVLETSNGGILVRLLLS